MEYQLNETISIFTDEGMCRRCGFYRLCMVGEITDVEINGPYYKHETMNLCLVCIEELYGGSNSIPENFCCED